MGIKSKRDKFQIGALLLPGVMVFAAGTSRVWGFAFRLILARLSQLAYVAHHLAVSHFFNGI